MVRNRRDDAGRFRLIFFPALQLRVLMRDLLMQVLPLKIGKGSCELASISVEYSAGGSLSWRCVSRSSSSSPDGLSVLSIGAYKRVDRSSSTIPARRLFCLPHQSRCRHIRKTALFWRTGQFVNQGTIVS